jgi:GlcNAc-P-P-Und epimerase
MILFTGGSGFLGENILPSLSQKYEINTLGLSEKDTYKLDLSKEIPLLDKKYEIVLHAAGRAHIIANSKTMEDQYFQINLQGTKNLCTALEMNVLPKALIFISTVAVYGEEFGTNIEEEHLLQGTSPYALSKIQAEEFLTSWCSKNNIVLGILRPSLIAGKNPPGNLGAMIEGIKSNRYLSIGEGKTKKSILMAEDIVKIIPRLAEIGGIYNICDDHHPSFSELESLISTQLGKKKPLAIPYWIGKVLALSGDILGDKFPINSLKLSKIVKPLTFSNEKAKRELNWQPLDVLSNFKIA